MNDGHTCPDHARVAFAGIFPSSHVDIAVRARGGGGDGGSTGAESRSSYLEMYSQKKPDKVVHADECTSVGCGSKETCLYVLCPLDNHFGVLIVLVLPQVNPEEEKLARWTTCKLSGECLAPPVCADEMGSLYNKSAVVSGLLSKSLPPSLAHISSLRHLIDLKLEPSLQSGKVWSSPRNNNEIIGPPNYNPVDAVSQVSCRPTGGHQERSNRGELPNEQRGFFCLPTDRPADAWPVQILCSEEEWACHQ